MPEMAEGVDEYGTAWGVSTHRRALVVDVGDRQIMLTGDERDRFAGAVARAMTPGQASDGGCPVAVVFGDGMRSCTLQRGHDGDHGYADEPDPF